MRKPVRSVEGSGVASLPSAGNGLRLRRWVLPVGFVIPSMVAVAGSILFALVILILISLRDIRIGRLDAILAAPLSIANYVGVLTDPHTWSSLWISVIYVVGTTAVPFLIGLLFALLLNQPLPGRRLLRTISLVPWAVPGVTATVAFVWIMQPTYGVLNYVLRTVGLTRQDINWFGSPNTALIAVMVPTIWKAIPFFVLLLLAGLQSINKELYEAAEVDGAGASAKFWGVTLPGIAPFVFISIVFGAMYSFRDFDFIYASTQGGPNGATETIAVRIFDLAFVSFDFGSAAALGVLTFVVILVFVILFLRHDKKGALEGYL